MRKILRFGTVMGIVLMGVLFPGDLTADSVILAPYRSQREQFNIAQVVKDLENPWSIAFLPGGEFLVTERRGRLLWISPGGSMREVAGVPKVFSSGQGGLLDVVLDPDFPVNRQVYFSFSIPGKGGSAGTAVARAVLGTYQLTNVQVLYEMEKKTSSGLHFGSRLLFGPDKFLYVSTGERGDRDRAQDLSDTAGKVLRIQPDGRVPRDNPFVGNRNASPLVFTYGHRNIQGMVLHPETGKIWIHEHGPRGGDEINILTPGANYGWPVITYGKEYFGGLSIGEGTHKEGMEQPILQWTPSIAPSGMTFYTGNRFPNWKGNLFVGALAGQHLRRIVLSGEKVVEEEVLLHKTLGRIRDVREGPDGFLYLLTDERKGGLYRLEPAGVLGK